MAGNVQICLNIWKRVHRLLNGLSGVENNIEWKIRTFPTKQKSSMSLLLPHVLLHNAPFPEIELRLCCFYTYFVIAYSISMCDNHLIDVHTSYTCIRTLYVSYCGSYNWVNTQGGVALLRHCE